MKGNDVDVKELLKQAVSAVDKAKSRANALEYAAREPIAIVGMGCRFPGGVDSPERFWRLLSQAEHAVAEVPADRWDLDAWYSPDPEAPGRMYSRWGGFVADIASFDPLFFGIAPREAVRMDPQHRLLLEVAWEALERAGIAPSGLSGSRAGVFVGVTANDYGDVLGQLASADAYHLTGNSLNFAAGRLSYTLGLRGPSLAVDTACSSSLTALHLACKSLRDRECDLALAGGVNAILSPKGHVVTCKARMQSPTGRCRTFDARADGMVRGEGCGVLVLKRLSDALRSGDPIDAVLRGTAVNQDGASGGLTVPSKDAQRAVMAEALAGASVAPADIDYVEAHGTGTPLGDPIELRALAEVFAAARPAQRPLLVGSVKTNLGHLESASGVAGVIKAVLALQHRQVPAHLHLDTPTPHFAWGDAPLRIPTQLTPWPTTERLGLAGVSSFGGSGTNAHAVLEAAPARPGSTAQWTRPCHLLPLSAKDPTALRALTRRYRDFLTDAQPFADAAHTAGAGRSHHALRRVVLATDCAEARAGLEAALADASAPGLVDTPAGALPPLRVAFLFSGQGSQYAGMGAELYRTQPLFRATLDRCSELLEPHLRRPLASLLQSPEVSDEELADTALAQPALYALQVSLAVLWRSWGITPAAVLGHSVGELAAAHVAGMLSLEDGCLLAAERGRLMAALPPGGAMAAAQARRELVEEVAAAWSGRLAVAAFNAPNSTVLSGDGEAVRACRGALADRGIVTKPLEVSHAFHSPLMDPMLDALEEAVSKRRLAAPAMPVVSGLTGRALGEGEGLRPGWWRRQAREPVEFQRGMASLRELGCNAFVEVGPQATLLGLGAACLGEDAGVWLPSLRRNRSDWRQLLSSLSVLYTRGADVDWASFDAGLGLRRILCPTYAFQRQRYWPEVPTRPGPGEKGPAEPVDVPLGSRALALLSDHRVYGEVIVPASFHLSELLKLPGVTEVTDVAFQEALALDDEGAETPRLRITRGDDAPGRFRVESAAPGQAAGQPVMHALGRAGPAREPRLPLPEGVPLAARGLEGPSAGHLGREDFYAAFDRAGIELGPAFRWVEELWHEPGRAVARMRAPEPSAAESSRDTLPAGLLDSLFQVIAATQAGEVRERAFIPFLLERLTQRQPCRGQLWAHARLRPSASGDTAGSFGGDLWLVDHEGTVVLEVSGLHVRAAPRRALQAGRRSRVARWLHRVSWVHTALSRERPLAGRWLLFSDEGGLGSEVARALEAEGASCVMVHQGTCFARLREGHFSVDPRRPADFAALRDAVAASGPPPSGVLHLWALDACGSASAPLEAELASVTEGVLHGVQSVALGFSAPPHLVVATRGAQCVGTHGDATAAPVQASVWGLVRTARSEYPELDCLLIDLDPSAPPSVADLAPLLCAGAHVHEVAVRGGRTWTPRLEPLGRGESAAAAVGGSWRLGVSERGSIANVVARPFPRRAPGAGEVEVEVSAAGINFRDVLNVLGMYPGDPGPMGGELAGRITAVGADVVGLHAGDRVAAVFPSEGGFATHATVTAALTVPLPEGLSYADAAASPVAFLSAWYGLLELGGLAAGERVLIHAAAGGVGLAAVQLARRAGAQVFATAGTPRKRAFLRRLGVEHVFDSRTVSFAEEIRARTGGAGVDLVLNSLTGEALHQSLALLAPGGRFMELGKRELLSDATLAALGRPVRYRPFDIIDEARRDMSRFRELLARVFAELGAGSLKPLPTRVFPLHHGKQALRFMASARHIGKVVLEVEGGTGFTARTDATYLLSGGTGALGLHTADWLAARGARHLVLLSRHEPGAAATARIDGLRAKGTTVVLAQADVGDQGALEGALGRALRDLPPLRGVVHAAGALDDAVFRDLNSARLAAVTRPKALGAWNLHALTTEVPLDFFILYGSTAALAGPMAQGNYAAANAFLDGLAHHRRQQGLPAQVVDWGPWAGSGMAATLGRARWAEMGLSAMAPATALTALELAMEQDEAQVAVLPLLQGELSPETRARAPALFRGLLEAVGAPAQEKVREAPVALAALPPDERHAKLRELVIAHAARALGFSAALLDLERPLAQLGLDSLMAAELRNALGRALGRPIPVTVLLEGPTVTKLVAQLERMLADGGDAQPSEPTVPQRAASARALAHEQALAQTLMGTATPGVTSHEVFRRRAEPLLQRLEQARREGLYYFETPITKLDGEAVHCAGGERKIMFATYSYLGLLGHPAIVRAAQEALERYGTGTHGVRLNGGTLELHKQLERRIAQFHGREAAVTFTSGFMTNYAAATTLVGPGDWVIGDQWNHASIVDGCRASGAVFRVFPHGDLDELERILEQAPKDVVRLVIADAVFSLDGDLLDLPRAVDLCRRHGAILMVDEAHSLGVLGASGRGIEEHFGMSGAVDLCMGTLSKTIPAVGGYLAGSEELITYLRFKARGYVFSAAMPPPVAAAALAAFDVIEREGAERRARLASNVEFFLGGLKAAGFDTGRTCTPIIPVIVGSEENAVRLTRHCQEHGLFAMPVMPPAVPVNTARLRLNVMASHTRAELERALAIIIEGGRALQAERSE